MVQTTKQSTMGVLSIIFSAITLLVAVLLIFHCMSIYLAGISPNNMGADGVRLQDIYSKEIVAQHFGQMAWAVWLWLAVLAAQMILPVVMPGAMPKSAPLRCKNKPEDTPEKSWYSPLRLALYAVAVIFIVAGILNQGMRDVLVKAVNICTECIGLG